MSQDILPNLGKMVLHVQDGKKFFDEQLLSYIDYGDDDKVFSILKNVDVTNLVDSSGMTLLHHAAMCYRESIVEYLIDQGCEVDASDIKGNTPMMYAVVEGHEDVVEVLFNANANIFACNEAKETPLSMAVGPQSKCRVRALDNFFNEVKEQFSNDSRKIAELLLELKSPFPVAILLNDAVITEYMLDNGCSINDLDPSNGSTALHYAIFYMNVKNVKLLLERGSDVNAKNQYGYKPFKGYLFYSRNSDAILSALLDHESSFNVPSVKGYQLAKVAFKCAQPDTMEMIMKYDFDFDNSTWHPRGKTLLHYIVRNIHSDVFHQLEGKKFDVHARDIDGRTALWDAAYKANPGGLKFLFKHGADPNIRDKSGNTVLYESIKQWVSTFSYWEYFIKNAVECVELFLKYGTDILLENTTGDTIFDIRLDDENVVIIQIVIWQVAVMEATSKIVKRNILVKLENDKYYKNFFALYRIEVEKLRKTMINETVCFLQFWIESEEKLLGYVRNSELAEKLKQVIAGETDSDILFVKFLKERAQNILKIAELRREAASVLSRISKCSNQDVIEKIISFLEKWALKKLCKI